MRVHMSRRSLLSGPGAGAGHGGVTHETRPWEDEKGYEGSSVPRESQK